MLLLLAGAALVLALLMGLNARYQDRLAKDASIRAVSATLLLWQGRVADIALGYAWWNDMLQHAHLTPDPAWFASIGPGLANQNHLAWAFVVAPDGSTRFALFDGNLVESSAGDVLGDGWQGLASRARDLSKVDQPAPVGGLLLAHGVAAVAVAAISPEGNPDGSPVTAANRSVLLLVRPLDAALMGEIGASLQIGDLAAVTSALQASGLPPHRLELEITESVLLANNSATNAALAAFQRLGIELAMDDFGTGYSSLSYLLGFRFGQIKIDRAFVAAIHRDGAAEAIIRAVIGMSRSLGIATTAEGVETAEQLAFLQRAGCSEIRASSTTSR